jgi:hypothetical protein
MGRSNFKPIVHKKKIKFGFKATCIWLFNPKAMDNKIQPSKIYILININNQGNEYDYTIDERIDHNQDWARNLLPHNFCI